MKRRRARHIDDRCNMLMLEWVQQAACRDVDPEMFFPAGDSHFAHMQIAAAKAVCRRCDVRKACLAWAVATESVEDIWGGLTEWERRSMSRRRSAEILHAEVGRSEARSVFRRP